MNKTDRRLIAWLDENTACIGAMMKGIGETRIAVIASLQRLETANMVIHHPMPGTDPDLFSLSPEGMKLHALLTED